MFGVVGNPHVGKSKLIARATRDISAAAKMEFREFPGVLKWTTEMIDFDYSQLDVCCVVIDARPPFTWTFGVDREQSRMLANLVSWRDRVCSGFAPRPAKQVFVVLSSANCDESLEVPDGDAHDFVCAFCKDNQLPPPVRDLASLIGDFDHSGDFTDRAHARSTSTMSMERPQGVK